MPHAAEARADIGDGNSVDPGNLFVAEAVEGEQNQGSIELGQLPDSVVQALAAVLLIGVGGDGLAGNVGCLRELLRLHDAPGVISSATVPGKRGVVRYGVDKRADF